MTDIRLVVLVLAPAWFAACGPGARSNGMGDDDEVDASVPGHDAPGTTEGTTFVYAHTSTKLYRVDPEMLTITEVGDFVWSADDDSMTDIAIDKTGAMIGISFTSVYSIDPATAKATRLTAGLTGDFNGLSYVPAATLGGAGDDVLVATRSRDGAVFRIDPMTGGTTQVGNMGQGFVSSGDLVSVTNFGTAQTARGVSSDRLVKLAPQTFQATPIGTNIGHAEIWGVAFWKDKLFGFTEDGKFVLIDPNTGVGTLVSSNGPAWWGAGVTTSAPVIF
ncbi:MAG: hypothetical protein AB7O24_11995 [Kofleriaceae bacterium]